MYYQDLFPDKVTETATTEFKSRLNRNDIVSWLKSVAAFANTEGGDFVIGVQDKTNQLQGFDPEGLDDERNYFLNQVNQFLLPKPKIDLSYPQYEEKGKTLYLISAHVRKSDYLPVVLKHKGFSLIFVRGEGQDNPATPEQITNLVLLGGRYPYDTMPSDEKYQPEHFTKLFSVYQERTGHPLNDKILSSAHFFDADGILARGSLLFEDGCDEANTEIKFAKWPGIDKASSLIPQMESFRGDLLSSIEAIKDFVERNSDHGYEKTPSGRIEVRSYPEVSVHEAAVNAVAHRNYYLTGAPIEVNLFRDRLEIVSPGSFVGKEKLNRDKNIADIRPDERNKLICAVLKRCRLMEEEGSGFDLIAGEYEGKKDPFKPYVSSDADSFSLTLPDLLYVGVLDSGNSALPEISYAPLPGKRPAKEKDILAYCYPAPRTLVEIASFLGVKPSSYLRKNILEPLVQSNYLRADESQKAIRYRTNRNLVRLL